MATITKLGELWDTNTGDHTVTATPAANDLIVVVHGMSGFAGSDNSTLSDNNSGGGGSYSKIGGNPLSTGGGTAGALWISIRNSLVTSATSTIFTETGTGNTGGGLTVLAVSGMARTGAMAARQNKGESTQTEDPPSIAFAAATLTANPIVLGVLGEDSPAGLTAPTDFAEHTDTGWSSPTTGIEVCSVNSGKTASSYSWSGGALADHNEVGVELDTTAYIIKAELEHLISSGGMIGQKWK